MKRHAVFILCALVISGTFFYSPCLVGAASFETLAEKGMKAFKDKDYQLAYDQFLKAFEIIPDHFSINFYLGRAAYEIGNYEMAVMVFERALIINPGDNRVKLEMSRAFHRLGVNDMARKNLNEVLLSDPPETVKQNIEKFLAYINRSEQRHFFSGTVSLGLDWNDNVWTSPSNNTISTILGRVSLTGPSAKEIDDFIYSAIAELNHTYSFPYSRFSWQTRGTGYKALYQKEHDLDTLYLSMETGPDYVLKKGVAGIHVTADYMDLDYAQYSDSVGGRAFYRHMFAPSLVVTPGLAYQSRSFSTNSSRDSDNFRFDLSTAFLVRGLWCNTILGFEQDRAEDNEYSYDRYLFELSVNREFNKGVTLYGSYSYAYSSYGGTSDLFDQPRRDHIHTVGCGIKKRLWQSSDQRQSFSVSLGYRHVRADANLDLYEYSKNIINSALEYRF